jgi:hypothetical protein
MSAFNNQNMPGVRKTQAGQVFIVKKDIKDMQPRRQLVEERKAKDAQQAAGATKPAETPKPA